MNSSITSPLQYPNTPTCLETYHHKSRTELLWNRHASVCQGWLSPSACCNAGDTNTASTSSQATWYPIHMTTIAQDSIYQNNNTTCHLPLSRSEFITQNVTSTAYNYEMWMQSIKQQNIQTGLENKCMIISKYQIIEPCVPNLQLP